MKAEAETVEGETVEGNLVLVISRLEYCNSLLAGVPASVIKPLQRIQNVAEHLMFNLPKFSHVTLLYRQIYCFTF